MKQLELFDTSKYTVIYNTSVVNKLRVMSNSKIDYILFNAELLEKSNDNRGALVEINKLRTEELTESELKLLTEVETELADKHNQLKRLGDD